MLTITTASSQPWQRWFWMLLLLNAGFIAGMLWYLQPLTAGEIVKYEVARNAASSLSIIDQWKLEGKMEKAFTGVYLDFAFIILYSTGLSVACIFFARLTRHEVLMKTGKFLSWCMIAVAACAILENIAMWQGLRGSTGPFVILMKRNMAVTKFSGIILATLFICVCFLFWVVDVFTARRERV